MERDTIVALSTPPGEGGIGIVRMSGPDSLDLAASIFVPGGKGKDVLKDLSARPRQLHYGHIVDREGIIIDEVLLSYMPGPYTYTREDVVEINAHGGALPLRKILTLLIDSGARLAEPGEFTRRAYLNGRIDLLQAESVISIIRAKSEGALRAAQQNLRGLLSTDLKQIKGDLLEVMAGIEAGLEFVDEDLDDELASYSTVQKKISGIAEKLKNLQEKSKQGRIMQEGLKTVIAGRPNVGKSSFYNYFLGEERAIVTEIPGTTRDLLEEYVNIRGVPLKIIDTAGIHREGDRDPVEKIGINFSKKAIGEADLVLFLLDASCGVTDEDVWIYQNLPEKMPAALVIVANKIDLGDKITADQIKRYFPQSGTVLKTSVKTGEGMEQVEEKIADLVFSGRASTGESLLVLQVRQGELINRAARFLQSALSSMEEGVPLDLVVIDIRAAKEALDELLGENVREDLLDDIFGRFCIGK